MGKLPADAAQVARLILDGMKSVLAQAGMTMDDRMSVQVFCADVAVFETFDGMDRTSFAKESPARTFIDSWRLLFGARVEVHAVAVRRT